MVSQSQHYRSGLALGQCNQGSHIEPHALEGPLPSDFSSVIELLPTTPFSNSLSYFFSFFFYSLAIKNQLKLIQYACEHWCLMVVKRQDCPEQSILGKCPSIGPPAAQVPLTGVYFLPSKGTTFQPRIEGSHKDFCFRPLRQSLVKIIFTGKCRAGPQICRLENLNTKFQSDEFLNKNFAYLLVF